MKAKNVVRSICGLCTGGCAVLVMLEDGVPQAIQGDPEGPNRGGLCKIGRAALEYVNCPDRLKHPLKRVGARGEGKWKEASWDETFGFAAEGLDRIKRESGPQSVAVVHGSAKGYMDTVAVRFANAFGTPNVVASDHVCYLPRMLAAELTFGYFPTAEWKHPPASIILWGTNKLETRFYVHQDILEAKGKGAKLITVDPLRIPHAEIADIWLQVRPGTDLLLALAMLNVIIKEELYDKGFVERWTLGFEKLREHVKAYSPEALAQRTWVPADLTRKAARLYAANRPAHIEWGNALDQTLNSFQTCRAIAILMAITGNLDVPGGEVESFRSGFRSVDTDLGNRAHGRWSHELELRDRLSPKERALKVDPDLLPDFRYVTPQSVVKAMREGKPYRIRAAFIQASNPLSSWSRIGRVYEAFSALDFLVVSDMFMTPTAALADVVFPVASFLEYDGAQVHPGGGGVVGVQRKVAQVGESLSDQEIVMGLASRLGLGEYFWKSLNDFWDHVFEPAGLTFEEFKKSFAVKKSTKQYRQYEQRGFFTPSGKVDLYSAELERWGFAPLPVFHDSPEMPLDEGSELGKSYPLHCTTRKVAEYRHSGGRQITSLRRSRPEPLVIIHPDTARKLDIDEGDWVFIESKYGRIRQKADLSTGVDPRVVVIDHAWWYPEKGQAELYGWAESNSNALTSDEPPFNREVGSFTIRGIACKVYKDPASPSLGRAKG